MFKDQIFEILKYGILILAAGAVLKILILKSGVSSNLPFKKKNYLFTKAERSFYHVLKPIAEELNFTLFAKVRLSDLIYTTANGNKKMTYFNKIKAKHIDYVLCDKTNIEPILAIELDDSSHNNSQRIDRDIFVNNALKAANLPILHINVRPGYNPNEIKASIMEKIKPVESTPETVKA